MNKIRVIMDSGKEHEIETPYSVQNFVDSFYNEIKMPMGGSSNYVMKNTFMFLDDDRKIMFNPTHVSSIEIIE